MPESNSETMKKIVPIKGLIDFKVFEKIPMDEDGFVNRMKKLTKNEELPIFFPGLPDFFKAKNQGLVTNREYIEEQLSLPAMLYDSDTYIQDLELRGPMEEIIYAYERERKRHGLENNVLVGEGWSKNFRKRIKKLVTSRLPLKEDVLDSNPEPEIPENPKGKKIA